MEDLSEVLRAAPFIVFAAAIDKAQLKERHACSVNPYSLALERCVDLIFPFLQSKGQTGRQTCMLIERRGKLEDKQLQRAFDQICERESLGGATTRELSIELVDKKANLPGLQIADLVATPLGRYLLKPHVQNRAFEAVREKLWIDSHDPAALRARIMLP